MNAALRFLEAKKIIHYDLNQTAPGSHTRILNEDSILRVSVQRAGILKKHVSVGDEIKNGYLLCEIIHPLEGNVIDQIVSNTNGTVFFSCSEQLVMEHTDVFNIIPQ